MGAVMESTEASLRVLFEAGTLTGFGDDRLLEIYRTGGREAAERAFAVLVDRHGPMVLGVCEAVLANRQDAEDAFQAVFLVLAQRAGTVRRGAAMSSWLYGVARRVSLRLRRTLARRQRLEKRRVSAERIPVTTAMKEPCPEIYEEVDRLPDSFRAAVVLCDLEGASYEEAASQLGCPIGTLQSRLARGRERLRERLAKRGFGPESLAMGMSTAGSVPPALVKQATHAAGAVAAGESAGGPATAVAVGLASAELRRAVLGRLVAAAGALGLAATVVVGAMALRGRDGGSDEAPASQAVAASAPEQKVVSEPIHVRIVDEKGRGVAGVAVDLFHGTDNPPLRRLMTDSMGIVMVPRDGMDGHLTLFASLVDDALAIREIVLDESAAADPDGTPARPIVMALRPLTHVVEGTVVDTKGVPIAGARIVAEMFSSTGPGPMGSFSASTAVLRGDVRLPTGMTDQRGRFQIRLPTGTRVWIRARHDRYFWSWDLISPDARTVGPIAMVPAGAIAGRVTNAETGRPLPRARVSAQPIENHPNDSQRTEYAQTDEEGRFSVGGLSPGVYNVVLLGVQDRPAATAVAMEGLRVRADQSTAVLLKVTEGRSLRGIVIDRKTGKPMAEILVGCNGPAHPMSGSALQSAKTDATGAFTFLVPPGRQSVFLMDRKSPWSRLGQSAVNVPEKGEADLVRLVWISRPAVAPSANDMVKAVAEPAKAVVAPAVVPEVPPAAESLRSVTGHVQDREGSPLFHVGVTWSDPRAGTPTDKVGDAVTDRDGTFVLNNLPTDEVRLCLRQTGFRIQEFQIPQGRDEVDVTFDRIPTTPPPPARIPDDPIPPDLAKRLHFVDLSDYAESGLFESPGGPGNDLGHLPVGARKLGGSYFRIGEFMIHLAGSQFFEAPGEMTDIPVKARGRTLHFLHGVQWTAKDGAEVGAYVIHYADGSFERIPIVYGRDVVNWWTLRRQRAWWDWFGPDVVMPTSARVAWIDEAANSRRPAGVKARLFAVSWTNPHPEKEIATLDMTSAGGVCDPFLVAVTVEE
ncbi:sigma-70 family RNA polymerase sigma factor [Aquisphaera insulae]|uniref:sigma-70 family RNA polymerase sigma factor n=1 Tax=Aquisphaera insulae TaxID=2712864 RepID=UPI0013EB683A|nr:sigma-70 family RNA polymerase sigma factor [Aquisphaera insulae]